MTKSDPKAPAKAPAKVAAKPPSPDAPVPGSTAVDTAVAIRAKYGEASFNRLGDSPIVPTEVIPSGSLALDLALGCGGHPRGRIIELYGPESAGKTTLALHAVAQAQRLGLGVAYIDAEHALDPSYASRIGCDIAELYLCQPDHGEQALGVVEDLARSGAFGLVVVDSVAALTPKAEIDGAIGDSHMGLHARLMSQAMRKITGVAAKGGTTLIFINQLRMKIGVLYGSPEVTTGGVALKFYASVRLDVRRREAIKSADGPVGNAHEIKVVKNKMAPPHKSAMVDIVYGQGIDRYSDLIAVALSLGVVQQKGSWFVFGEERLAQGRNNARERLADLPKLREQVFAEVQLRCPSLVWV